MTKAYSYVRWSTPDQTTGDSKRRQREAFDNFCTAHDLTPDPKFIDKFIDKGKSARTGKHKEEGTGFASFLSLVNSGQIPQGSVLVVEALDRMSRELPDVALSQMCSIIRAGVNVGVCRMGQIFTKKELGTWAIQNAFSAMVLAFQESEQKSERCGAAWSAKKKAARESGKAMTKNLPSWLRIVDGKIVPIPEKAAIVKRIFRDATTKGIMAITKQLNADSVPVVGSHGKASAGIWQKSYVAKLLNNQAVLGFHQPYTYQSGKKIPDGAPIPGYYHAIITEDEWHEAHGEMEIRKNKSGREAVHRTNLFAGLLFDAGDGSPMHAHNKRGNGHYTIQSYASEHQAQARSFPLATLENALLDGIREIDPREIMPTEKTDDIAVIQSKLATIETRIKKLQSHLLADDDIDPVVDAIRTLQADKKILQADLQTAQQKAASPTADAWTECGSILDYLVNNSEEKDIRYKLRTVIRRIIDRIDVFVTSKGRVRIAACEITFVGFQRRNFIIWHRPAYVGRGPRKEQEWGYQSGSNEESYKADDDAGEKIRIGFPNLAESVKKKGKVIEEFLQWFVTA